MAKLLRIAFCGASGTGKTTLARYVSERYKLPINPVGSRSIANEMGFASPYEVDKAGRRGEFQELLLTRKTQWERDHDHFVTDRTVCDNLAYTALHNVESVMDSTLASVERGMRRYTHVIYCPIGVFRNLDGDPSRHMSIAYHRVFDSVVEGMLSAHVDYATRLFDLSEPGLDARKVAIVNVLG